jgi:hypothetical protein
VVEHPRREPDGGVQRGVADGLRPGGLLEEVAEGVRQERLDGLVRRALLRRRRRQVLLETERRGEQVDVDAAQPVGRLAASSAQARAIRPDSRPSSVGSPEKP